MERAEVIFIQALEDIGTQAIPIGIKVSTIVTVHVGGQTPTKRWEWQGFRQVRVILPRAMAVRIKLMTRAFKKLKQDTGLLVMG